MMGLSSSMLIFPVLIFIFQLPIGRSWKLPLKLPSTKLQFNRAAVVSASIFISTVFQANPLLPHSTASAEIATTEQMSSARTSAYSTYDNDLYRFSFNYPKNWIANDLNVFKQQQQQMKVFIDPNDKDTSVTVFMKSIPADYTALGSFGGPESIRLFILPRDEQIQTKIVNEKTKGNVYGIEYIIETPNNPTRHVYNSFALQPSESIISLLIQTPEETFVKNQPNFQLITESFQLRKAE